MRAFSIFLSALALANLAEATPLHYTELGQVEAELELEALPGQMGKADYKDFLNLMKRLTDYALIGVPYVSTTDLRHVHEHWNDDGHMEHEEIRTSNLKLEALDKIGRRIKNWNGVYQKTPEDTSDEYRYW